MLSIPEVNVRIPEAVTAAFKVFAPPPEIVRLVKDVEVGMVCAEAELNSRVPAQALEAGIGVALVLAVFILPLLVNIPVPAKT